MKTFYLSGNHDDDYFLDQSDMSEQHWDILMGCHHQGACDDDCEFATKYFDIKDYEQALNWLIDCGIESERFIDDDNNQDDDAILMYYLWILSGDIQDRQLEDNNETL